MEQKAQRKRFVMDIDPKLHERIRIMAHKHCTTMSNYVLGCIINKIKMEQAKES